MDLRTLTGTEIRISPIGLGCWQFSERKSLPGKFWPVLPQALTREIVAAALDGGINWFDTAELYGNGASEAALADALRSAGKRPGDVVVATKWAPLGRTADHLIRSIGERKKFLGEYPVDLHQIHFPGSFSTIGAEAKALAQLVKQGDVRSVGVSNYSASQMRRMHKALAKLGVPLVSNQVEYSLLKRNIERDSTLETAKELGITIIAYSPLAQGILSGKFHDDPALVKQAGLRRLLNRAFHPGSMKRSQPLINTLKEIAQRHNVTPSQVALNWLVTFHGDTVVAIPGATKVKHAQENVGAMGFQLSDAEKMAIDTASARI